MSEQLKKCKACQKEIGKKVKKCVHCGTDQRSWFGRHKILTGIGILIVLGILASLGGGDDSSSKKGKDTNSSIAVDKDNSKSKNEEKAKSYKIGDEVKVGDMVYKINEKKAADQVGPSALPQKASGKYVVVNVTLKNNGNEAVTVDSSFFNLKLGEKTYEADSMGSMSANQKEDGNIDNSFFLQKVNPDLEITGFVVFDVSPEVADSKDLQLQVQTGAFGTEKELINLK